MQTYKLAPEKNVNFQFKTKLLAVQQWAMPLKRKWQSNMLTDFDSKESLNHHKSHISFMKHPLHLCREPLQGMQTWLQFQHCNTTCSVCILENFSPTSITLQYAIFLSDNLTIKTSNIDNLNTTFWRKVDE